MTEYFSLLRKHQNKTGEEAKEPPELPGETSPVEEMESLLLSEDELPGGVGGYQCLEDTLLCEEEAADTSDDSSDKGEASGGGISASAEVSPEPAPEGGTAVSEGDDERGGDVDSAPPPVGSEAATDDSFPMQEHEFPEGGSEDSERDELSAHVRKWLRRFITISYAVMHASRRNQPYDMEPLQKHVSNLLVWLERDASLVNVLELELEQADFARRIPEGHDDLRQLVVKSVMMLLYAVKTTAELKSPFKIRLRLVMAAVLQHVGMAQVPEGILSKTGRLSPDELAEIREAPAKGAAWLERCGVTDEYILRAAAESNERVDGSGPRGLQGKDICYSARLIGLLSMFEAMIHARSYRKRMLPREAVRVVVQKFKSAFDRTMLKALLDAISLYPVGSFVRLNSKEIGKVIFCHPRLPLRPVVRVMMDEYGEEIPPREIDLKKHPNLMIEQCAYEDNIASLLTEEPE